MIHLKCQQTKTWRLESTWLTLRATVMPSPMPFWLRNNLLSLLTESKRTLQSKICSMVCCRHCSDSESGVMFTITRNSHVVIKNVIATEDIEMNRNIFHIRKWNRWQSRWSRRYFNHKKDFQLICNILKKFSSHAEAFISQHILSAYITRWRRQK